MIDADPLVETLRELVLPRDVDLLFLRSIFGRGDVARAAWIEWKSIVADPLEALSARGRPPRSFLPLVHDALERNRIEEEAKLLTLVRSALLTERLRVERFGAIAHDALGALAGEEIVPIVLKGAATGPVYYREPAHRHAHDLEILVGPGGRRPAVRVLERTGFRRARTTATGETLLVDASGLPVRVHASLRPVGLELDTRRSTVERALYGVPCRVLSRSASLLHTLLHALQSPSRSSLRWIGDVAMLIGDGSAIDWEEFVEKARATDAALAVRLQLGALGEALGLPVPPTLHSSLAPGSKRSARAARRFAVERGWAGSVTAWRRLFVAAGGVGLRLALIRALIVRPPFVVTRRVDRMMERGEPGGA